MRTGRPVRFLVAVFGGWIGLRTFVLWPVPGGMLVVPRMTGRAVAAPVVHRSVEEGVTTRTVAASRPAAAPPPVPLITSNDDGQASLSPTTSTWEGAAANPIDFSTPEPSVHQDDVKVIPSIFPPPAPPSRWSGSVWVIARPDGTGGGLGASQLGGSQAGVRVAYAVDDQRRLALVARVATPIERRGREAALGVEWRPPGLPVRLVAEQRFALDRGARGGPGVGVIGGVDERIGALRLEAYGQAGAIARDGLDGYADGAARLTRRSGAAGPVSLDMGVGAWGGAQRDAERLDVGPTVGASIPVGGRRIRLTLDYRARVAGAARPGSGPALSLGTDF